MIFKQDLTILLKRRNLYYHFFKYRDWKLDFMKIVNVSLLNGEITVQAQSSIHSRLCPANQTPQVLEAQAGFFPASTVSLQHPPLPATLHSRRHSTCQAARELHRLHRKSLTFSLSSSASVNQLLGLCGCTLQNRGRVPARLKAVRRTGSFPLEGCNCTAGGLLVWWPSRPGPCSGGPGRRQIAAVCCRCCQPRGDTCQLLPAVTSSASRKTSGRGTAMKSRGCCGLESSLAPSSANHRVTLFWDRTRRSRRFRASVTMCFRSQAGKILVERPDIIIIANSVIVMVAGLIIRQT